MISALLLSSLIKIKYTCEMLLLRENNIIRQGTILQSTCRTRRHKDRTSPGVERIIIHTYAF